MSRKTTAILTAAFAIVPLTGAVFAKASESRKPRMAAATQKSAEPHNSTDRDVGRRPQATRKKTQAGAKAPHNESRAGH